jgi:hypothetical protein
MKKIIVKMAVLFGLGVFMAPAYGQTTVDIPGFVSLNLNSITQNAGVADFVDNHGRNWAGPSVRIAWYPSDATKAYGGLEVAVPWDTANGKPAGAFLWLGLRADTLGSKILPDWIGHLNIPNFEFGPGGGYLYNQRQWVGFLGFAKHF